MVWSAASSLSAGLLDDYQLLAADVGVCPNGGRKSTARTEITPPPGRVRGRQEAVFSNLCSVNYATRHVDYRHLELTLTREIDSYYLCILLRHIKYQVWIIYLSVDAILCCHPSQVTLSSSSNAVSVRVWLWAIWHLVEVMCGQGLFCKSLKIIRLSICLYTWLYLFSKMTVTCYLLCTYSSVHRFGIPPKFYLNLQLIYWLYMVIE